MRRWLVLAGVLGLSLAGLVVWRTSVQSPPQLEPRRDLRADVAGCYQLTSSARIEHMPGVIKLDSVPLHGEDTQFRKLRTNSPTTDSLFRFQTWVADSRTDTLHVTISSGFSGTTYVLAGYGDTLRGYVGTFTDIQPSWRRRGSATAVRIPCDDAQLM